MTWRRIKVELPVEASYARIHGLPSDIGLLVLEGALADRELIAPVVTALMPNEGERLVAIVVNAFGDRMDRDHVLGPIVAESGSHEMRAVTDVPSALLVAATLPAEEIAFIRVRMADTAMIVKALVFESAPLLKFENRTSRGEVAGALSPEFVAAFFSSSHESIEILGRARAIWPILQSMSVMAVPV